MARLARLRRALRRLGRRTLLENALTTVAFLGGLALVATGVALVSLPAGLIVAGAELVAGSALYARGGAR